MRTLPFPITCINTGQVQSTPFPSPTTHLARFKMATKARTEPEPSVPSPPTTQDSTPSRTPTQPKSNEPVKTERPTDLTDLPLELLETGSRAGSEERPGLLALTTTCKALWLRWGRKDDCPLERWGLSGIQFNNQQIFLFLIPNPAEGEVGYLPFHTEYAQSQSDGLIVYVLEVKPKDLQRRGSHIFLDAAQTIEMWNSGESRWPSELEVHWHKGQHRLASATQELLALHCPCPTCFRKGNASASFKLISKR